jgi:hypothetical protein
MTMDGAQRVRFEFMFARLGILLAGFLLAGLNPASAEAQSKPAQDVPAEYRSLVDEAVREYEARHFEEARSLFAKAVAVLPSARAYRGLGMAEFELRNYIESAESLERALAATIKPIEGELRAETERLLSRARSFLARFIVVVQPAQTVVLVDGNEAALSPLGELFVPVGDHRFEFRAEGHLSEHQTRKIKGGEQEQLIVTLKPLPSPAAVAAAAPDDERQRAPLPIEREPGQRPLYKNGWLWTAVGVAVVGVAVGLGVGLAGRDGGTEPAVAGEPAAVLVGPS